MTTAPLKVTEMVRKVNVDTPAANGTGAVDQGNTLRFHIPYVGGNAILNPHSMVIRGRFLSAGLPFFMDNGVHCLFSTLRVLHGDRVIEVIERYDDFAEMYLSLHNGGKWGSSLRAQGEFCQLGNYSPGTVPLVPTTTPVPLDANIYHEFAFQPLSALLGSRATKIKFPLCVLNPMEPLVLELDIDPNSCQVNWTNVVSVLPTFTLSQCYLNADYDMVGSALGTQLKMSMSGIEWDIPGFEKHEKDFVIPEVLRTWTADPTYWGGDKPPQFSTEFLVRSNVQAMTRMLHYFKNKDYDRVPKKAAGGINMINGPRNFLTYPELTSWHYQIANQPVPDRPITAEIYITPTPTPAKWPRAHFGRMWTTTMKVAGDIVLAPKCGFAPKQDFAWDYSKKLSSTTPLPSNGQAVASLTQPFNVTGAIRGDDGTFFVAYDFTRHREDRHHDPWGEGSFKLKDTEFMVEFGFNNMYDGVGITSTLIRTIPQYTLVMVTLVEYKRRLVIDKLGRLEAYF